MDLFSILSTPPVRIEFFRLLKDRSVIGYTGCVVYHSRLEKKLLVDTTSHTVWYDAFKTILSLLYNKLHANSIFMCREELQRAKLVSTKLGTYV